MWLQMLMHCQHHCQLIIQHYRQLYKCSVVSAAWHCLLNIFLFFIQTSHAIRPPLISYATRQTQTSVCRQVVLASVMTGWRSNQQKKFMRFVTAFALTRYCSNIAADTYIILFNWSEWVNGAQRPTRYVIGHFGNRVFLGSFWWRGLLYWNYITVHLHLASCDVDLFCFGLFCRIFMSRQCLQALRFNRNKQLPKCCQYHHTRWWRSACSYDCLAMPKFFWRRNAKLSVCYVWYLVSLMMEREVVNFVCIFIFSDLIWFVQ